MEEGRDPLSVSPRGEGGEMRNKENHENPIDGIITLSEYSPLLVLILLVCKHTDSLTTKNGIPYQESNPINGKTVKTEGRAKLV